MNIYPGPDQQLDSAGDTWRCGRCGLHTQGGMLGLEMHQSVVHGNGSVLFEVCSNASSNDCSNTSNDIDGK